MSNFILQSTFQIFLGIPVEKMGHNAVEGKGDRAADGECRGAFQLRGGNDHNGIAAAGADVEMDGAAHHLADVHLGLYAVLGAGRAEHDVLGPHAEGDRAIQEIGHILSGALVANSVAIRISGDEFMVLIRHGSEELLDKTCAAIERRVQHYNATAPAGSFQLSFSTGVAKYEGGSM